MKLDGFDRLPGVWDESSPLCAEAWSQILATLAAGEPLNDSERMVLVRLLCALSTNASARNALGFIPQKSRTAKRNAEIADAYVEGMATHIDRATLEVQIMRRFRVTAKALEKIVQSGAMLQPARGRLLARRLAERARRGDPVIVENELQLRTLLADSDPPRE